MHSTLFHEYLRKKEDYYDFYADRLTKNEKTKLIQLIRPTDGSPFNFFIWYFSCGFHEYISYWRDLDFVYSDTVASQLNDEEEWTITVKFPGPPEETFETFIFKLKDDLHKLLELEFYRVVKIYNDRWSSTGDKQAFLQTFHSDVLFFDKLIKEVNWNSFSNKIVQNETAKWVDNLIPRFKTAVEKLTNGYYNSEVLHRTTGGKRTKKPGPRTKRDVFKIDNDKAKKLYQLAIPRNEKNGTFISAEDSDSATQFQKILTTDNYTGQTFTFDFETKYVAFVLRWLQKNKIFSDVFPAFERMNCFKTKDNIPITANNLRQAFSTYIKGNNEKWLHRNRISMHFNLPDKPIHEDFLKYLSSKLKAIFFPESAS